MAKGVLCTAAMMPGVPLTRVTHAGKATSVRLPRLQAPEKLR